jgi:hypothetical protein
MNDVAEKKRLDEARAQMIPGKKWGSYLSERQWGTVREDYSENGDAWNYFTHDHARSRAYRWGEEGFAGISDDKQLLCFALALWNGNDPILKERLFGLTNSEGNHGEDVNLFEVSKEIASRFTQIFLRDNQGKRPVYGGSEKFQTDPHWRDHILFYEYSHGDSGSGLGASHQTGWTGLVAKLIQLYGLLDAKKLLEAGRAGIFSHDR